MAAFLLRNLLIKFLKSRMGTSLGQAAASSGRRHTDAFSASSDGDWMRSSIDLLGNEVNVTENSGGREVDNSNCDGTVNVYERLQCQIGLWRGAEKSSSYPEDSSSLDKSEGGCSSFMNTTNVLVQLLDQMEEHSCDKIMQAAELASDLFWEMNENEYIMKTKLLQEAYGISFSILQFHIHLVTLQNYGQKVFMQNGFAIGSKKPRTWFSYS